MEQNKKRVPLYNRLPEIYHIKDQDQGPPDQLKSYLALVESVFKEIHKNIECLYHDLFIETCDDWVIPYIGDLLGVSHLKGDPRTLRADVADTIALRRRKGTLAGMERLTYNMTGWGVHCVELRENMVWNQHLNHQRPDAGGDPPYSLASVNMHTPIRGGTVTLRDPAMLSLLYTSFDPFAHTADVKPPAFGNIRYNLPNLAIFLWRLKDYRVRCSKPFYRVRKQITGGFCVRFEIHPQGEPVRLFNIYQFDPDRDPPVVTRLDETPNPVQTARLNEGSEAGNPGKYVAVDTYDPVNTDIATLNISDVGLQLHLPEPGFNTWTIRGANLCAWEEGVKPPVKNRDIIIDPVIGRIIIGVASIGEANALKNHLLVTYTYGAVGPVGAHPISRKPSPETFNGETVKTIDVEYGDGPAGLTEALNKADMANATSPVVIQIPHSSTYELDIKDVTGVEDKDGNYTFLLNKSLIIRAADNQRPVIKLARPLRFRPKNVQGTTPEEQETFEQEMSRLTVRLEGLYLTRGDEWDTSFPPNPWEEPLLARAALNRLEIIGCTLDPGGYKKLDDTRASIYRSVKLNAGYDFTESGEQNAFNQIPEIFIKRCITGPLFIDTDYRLFLTDSIIDAGKGVNDDPEDNFAVSGADDPVDKWGPPTQFEGITVFGRMRVESISGKGGIFVHSLEVLDHQKGCIKFSYFSGQGDRLPQNHGCVKGTEAYLCFVSEIFGQSAYGQLHHTTDFRIKERGPGDDAMGAFGFLMEAHKWRNLKIRFREFMPVGVRPLLIPVT
jgi:hypothetical protein